MIEIILDKGLVIDAYVRVSLIGIELITVDARIVVASVDTYLRFAEAVNRLDMSEDGSQGLPELMETVIEDVARRKTKGAIEGGHGEDPRGRPKALSPGAHLAPDGHVARPGGLS